MTPINKIIQEEAEKFAPLSPFGGIREVNFHENNRNRVRQNDFRQGAEWMLQHTGWFSEWIADNDEIFRSDDKTGWMYAGQFYTTDQLKEKYFESLNKQTKP
jgi:hypothetical protein